MLAAIASAMLLTAVPPSSAGAADWSAFDTAAEAAVAAALVMDWAQTRSSLERGGMELNPVLGHHPSEIALDGYFAAALALHAAVAMALPRPYRTAWQAVFLGVEMHAVYSNFRVGVGVSF